MHYNGANCYLFVNGGEIIKCKGKDLGTNSKDFSVDNMKKIGFYGYFYDYSVDYDAVAVDDILDIHKYLMKKKI